MNGDVTHRARGDSWGGILAQDEEILWQGRPDAKPKSHPRRFVSVLFGAAFSGFALFWMAMAAQAGGLFWMFGLIHFGVGIGIMVGPIYSAAWRRRHTWYTLTNKNAYIGTDVPFRGRKLASYPITAETALVFSDEGDFATIHFAHEMRKSGKRGSKRHDIGFERIKDGRDVYAMMRELREART